MSSRATAAAVLAIVLLLWAGRDVTWLRSLRAVIVLVCGLLAYVYVRPPVMQALRTYFSWRIVVEVVIGLGGVVLMHYHGGTTWLVSVAWIFGTYVVLVRLVLNALLPTLRAKMFRPYVVHRQTLK